MSCSKSRKNRTSFQTILCDVLGIFSNRISPVKFTSIKSSPGLEGARAESRYHRMPSLVGVDVGAPLGGPTVCCRVLFAS